MQVSKYILIFFKECFCNREVWLYVLQNFDLKGVKYDLLNFFFGYSFYCIGRSFNFMFFRGLKRFKNYVYKFIDNNIVFNLF